MAELISRAIVDTYKAKYKDQNSLKRDALDQLNNVQERLNNARRLMADEKIEPEDFMKPKKECNEEMQRLEQKIASTSDKIAGVDEMVLFWR